MNRRIQRRVLEDTYQEPTRFPVLPSGSANATDTMLSPDDSPDATARINHVAIVPRNHVDMKLAASVGRDHVFLGPPQTFQRGVEFLFTGRNHRFAGAGHQVSLPIDPVIQSLPVHN